MVNWSGSYGGKKQDKAQKEKKEWEVKFEATLARFEKWKESSKNLKNDKSSDSETYASCDSSPNNPRPKLPPAVDIKTLPESDVEDPNSTAGSPSFSCLENVKSPRIFCNKSGMNNRNVCKNNSVRVKKCFVCGSKLHLIKDCDFYNCVDSVPLRRQTAVNSAGRPNSAAGLGDPSTDNDIGIVDSGCSRSMTGNKEKLDDFVQIKGGIVKFGGGDGRISGKGTIRTSKLDFENVYYVEELQHFTCSLYHKFVIKKNKFSLQTPDCWVLSKEFQLPMKVGGPSSTKQKILSQAEAEIRNHGVSADRDPAGIDSAGGGQPPTKSEALIMRSNSHTVEPNRGNQTVFFGFASNGLHVYQPGVEAYVTVDSAGSLVTGNPQQVESISGEPVNFMAVQETDNCGYFFYRSRGNFDDQDLISGVPYWEGESLFRECGRWIWLFCGYYFPVIQVVQHSARCIHLLADKDWFLLVCTISADTMVSAGVHDSAVRTIVSCWVLWLCSGKGSVYMLWAYFCWWDSFRAVGCVSACQHGFSVGWITLFLLYAEYNYAAELVCAGISMFLLLTYYCWYYPVTSAVSTLCPVRSLILLVGWSPPKDTTSLNNNRDSLPSHLVLAGIPRFMLCNQCIAA
ncbi:hypothetical protein Tco_0386443 [Tanacetum coccineum]